MFGVLVVADEKGSIGYLSAFSGMLNQQWLLSGFVPPVFDSETQANILSTGGNRLRNLTHRLEESLSNPERLLAAQQLVALEQQKKTDLTRLKAVHLHNKEQRKIMRQSTQLDDKQALLELSLLSQQDKRAYKQVRANWDDRWSQARQRFDTDFELEIERLSLKRKALSQSLHERLFEGYRLRNRLGEEAELTTFFADKSPPSGAADCAAPKLLQYAHQHGLIPLALAEFWWGASPANGVRHHAHFYPPCRGKCEPILPFMLRGLDIQRQQTAHVRHQLQPEIVYEDDSIVVLNKPPGLLSIPGKQESCSVLSWLQQRYPQASGALLLHRLDMDTSGLLLAAKNAQAYKHCQRQFIERRVKKRYVAVLSKAIRDDIKTIELPLRVDLDDRPRQLVCHQHGKPATTHLKLISSDGHTSRVYFYPVTGRTHQLRVHAAHFQGLAAPIIGDRLYGTGAEAERMLLHAEVLCFEHPLTEKRMEFKVKAAF